MKCKQLLEQLERAGLQAVVLQHESFKLVVTPYGARILGVFTHDEAENAFFVNPELADPAAAQKMLAGVHVLGGDRLWLAPERGLFFYGTKLSDGGTVQRSIDPGEWVVGHLCRRSIKLTSSFSADYFLAPGPRKEVRGALKRSVRAISSPFHYAPDAVSSLSRVQFAGYEIASSFELQESPIDALHIGMWFLIQMVVPRSGYLYVPTLGRTVATDYYEPSGPEYLKVADNHVRFKLDSIERHKIGVRKTEVTGRAGFLSNAGGAGGDKATLVVRNFLCNPSAHYCDVPMHTPEGVQDCVQSYSHNSGPEGFGELEYHTPSVSRRMPDPSVTDTNQVWVFTGKREDLVPIASRLLNLPPDTFTV